MGTVSILLMLAMTASPESIRSHDIVGIWEAESGNYQVEIYQEAGAYAGKLIWLEENLDYEGKPIRDWLNPNEKLKGQKVEGSVCLIDLRYVGEGTYGQGKVYDFLSGRHYQARIELLGRNRAKLRGFIAMPILGRSEYFRRVE